MPDPSPQLIDTIAAAIHPTILADRHSACPDCDEWIRPGDPIHLIETIGWAHVTCPTIPTACREICNQCFTEKAANGSCMCVSAQ